MQNVSGTLAVIHIGGIQSYFRHRNCERSEDGRGHCLQFIKQSHQIEIRLSAQN